jgi:FMN phosphatase YigB (HAD superfamily)
MTGQVKTIVFDLDGTLYQHMSYHSWYIEALLQRCDNKDFKPHANEIIGVVDEIISGNSPIKMNEYYNQCTIGKENFKITSIREVLATGSRGTGEQLYDESRVNEDIIFLGDAWWVVRYVAIKIGMEAKYNNQQFFETQQKICEGLSASKQFVDILKKISKQYEIALLTGSLEKTARTFIKKLGVRDIFGKNVVYDCKKAHNLWEGLEGLYPGISERPETVLSIGDNIYKDLEPIRNAGGKVLWINPYAASTSEYSYEEITGTRELVDYLRQAL